MGMRNVFRIPTFHFFTKDGLFMKKIILLSTITAMMLCLTSCGNKCAVCGEINIYGNEEVMGMTVCGDCMDDARALGGL